MKKYAEIWCCFFLKEVPRVFCCLAFSLQLSSCLVKAPKITYFLSWICSRHTVVWKPKFRQTEQCAHEPDAAKLAHCNVALGSRPRQLHAPCVASIPRDAQAKNFQWIDWTKFSHLIAFVFSLLLLGPCPAHGFLENGKIQAVSRARSLFLYTTNNRKPWRLKLQGQKVPAKAATYAHTGTCCMSGNMHHRVQW